MRLVIIYGQEATGKLTIAKALAAKTGFKLFHNHVSIDVANTLYQYGEPEYDQLVMDVRLLVFESAAKNGIPGMLFTWAYTHPQCYDQFLQIQETLKRYDSLVHPVFVHCSQQALETRVVSSSRAAMGKINSIEHLHRQQQRKQCIEIPDAGSLVVDNTAEPPEKVAEKIMSQFSLAPAERNGL